MTKLEPWSGDACSLVDAFRAGDHSPVDELDATLAAIEASDLNAFSFLDVDAARQSAATADVSAPFGGVPTAVKELEIVEGWPRTEASLVFKDRIADFTSTHIERLFERGGVVPVGLTTASEFGGLNVSVTKLNGITRNPWNRDRTVGGSSSGSAAAVAGGLITLATGGDGGGSIRIPAGYTGMLGMKGTFGRIPRGPHAFMRPNTVVLGNVARSVRDAARYFDVCGGFDGADPTSLPDHQSFEAGLGTHDLKGLRVAIVPALGGVTLEPGVEEHLRAQAELLIREHDMVQVDIDLQPPNLAAQWMIGNTATLLADLGDRWPGCADELTSEISAGLYMSQSLYNLQTAAKAELMRIESNNAMAAAFAEVDLVIAATNPGPAFPAEWTTSAPNKMGELLAKKPGKLALRTVMGATRAASSAFSGLPNSLIGRAAASDPDLVTMGGLTIISNVYGNPAVSIPAGTIDGLPVGMQVLAAHHRDDLLFDVALAVERDRPWPLTAPA